MPYDNSTLCVIGLHIMTDDIFKSVKYVVELLKDCFDVVVGVMPICCV